MPPREIVTPVTPDIYQVRLPLPFALNHVNCYLIRGREGWTVLDTGLNTPPAQAAWQTAFTQLAIQPQHLHQIILTHTHPDHFGMVGWLQSLDPTHTIPVYTSPIEAKIAQRVWFQEGQGEFDMYGYLRRGGLTDAFLDEVYSSFLETRAQTFPHPPALALIHAGTQLHIGERTFDLIHAPGHSDGQLILYDAADQLMLSGDHVLMGITPNIGLWAESSPNPLGEFLASLHTLENYPVRLGLPGHKSLITDWRGRLQELQVHHGHRLEQAQHAVTEGATTAYEIAQQLFEVSRFTVHEWRFAVAETLAHLEYLRAEGKLQREDTHIWEYHLAR